MRNLPKGAQIYWVWITLIGTFAAAYAAWMPAPKSEARVWEFTAYLALAALVGRTKIVLLQRNNNDDTVSMSLAYVLTFTAMMRFGPGSALIVGAVGSLSNCLYPRRIMLHQMVFNVALAMVEALTASMVFLSMNNHSLALRDPASYPAVAAASAAFFLVNTGGVAVIIALCAGQNAGQVWRKTFFWTAPSYFAGACLSTLCLLLFRGHSAYVLLLLSPLGWVLYQNYATTSARTEEKQQHIEELQLSQEHLADLYLATIKSLALAIDAKDQYTHQHILRVQRYAVATAQHLGLVGNELEAINTGALLHDIGKLGVPEYVLLKPGRLTDEEFAKIKRHPEIGAAILDPVEFPWPVLPVVRSHHEKWDGTGYPDGLAGEAIPRTARILAVADVYDALTSSRSYRSAWTHERACEVIRKDRGTHFDPVVADAFLEIISGIVEEMAQRGDSLLGGTEIAEKSAVSRAVSPSDQADPATPRDLAELWALYEIAQTLSSSLGLEETLGIFSRKLEALLPRTAALFLLYDTEAEHPELVVRSAGGINQEFFIGARTLGSTSLAVAHDHVSFLGDYDPDDLLLISSQATQWKPLQTALIVPLVHQGEALGTINLYHSDQNAFSSHDVQLLETIANRVATAVYHGLRFDRTRSEAVMDPLTGLNTIRQITQYIEARCLENAPFVLLCLDLDGFKAINDKFGHQKGDQILCDLAAQFSAALGKSNIAARYGGDQFLIFVPGGTQEDAEVLTARLHSVVETYTPDLIHPRFGALRLSVSIGSSCSPRDGLDFASLAAAADAQLHGQKTERTLRSFASEVPSVRVLSSSSPHSRSSEAHLPQAA